MRASPHEDEQLFRTWNLDDLQNYLTARMDSVREENLALGQVLSAILAGLDDPDARTFARLCVGIADRNNEMGPFGDWTHT